MKPDGAWNRLGIRLLRTTLVAAGIAWFVWYYHADDPSYWFYANFEDPNDRGYDAIRRIFLNEMAAVLPHTLPGAPLRPGGASER